MGARYYDSFVGRFISRDPVTDMSDSVSFNKYVYCRNNPLNLIDPKGLQAEEIEEIMNSWTMWEELGLTEEGLAMINWLEELAVVNEIIDESTNIDWEAKAQIEKDELLRQQQTGAEPTQETGGVTVSNQMLADIVQDDCSRKNECKATGDECIGMKLLQGGFFNTGKKKEDTKPPTVSVRVNAGGSVNMFGISVLAYTSVGANSKGQAELKSNTGIGVVSGTKLSLGGSVTVSFGQPAEMNSGITESYSLNGSVITPGGTVTTPLSNPLSGFSVTSPTVGINIAPAPAEVKVSVVNVRTTSIGVSLFNK
ncbi:MAG: RHS repeat-associated core domain-containing protein, partial [Elusimicrobiota bacterium]